MAANVAIDAVGGSVPMAGDAFDVCWKANQRNMQLLDRHSRAGAADRRQSTMSDIVFFGVLTALAFAAAVGGFVLTFTLAKWVYSEMATFFA